MQISPTTYAQFCRALAKLKISPAAFYVLWRSGETSKPRLADIVAEFQTTFPSVSVLVKRMCGDGQVERLQDGSFRRTAAGNQLFFKIGIEAATKNPKRNGKRPIHHQGKGTPSRSGRASAKDEGQRQRTSA